VEVAKLRTFGAVGAAWLLLLAHAPAHAEARRLRLSVAEGACPSAALLQQQLAPLLQRDVTLEFGPAAEGAASGRVTVEDYGESYAIDVDGRSREVDDPARDCLERARVAAVFIALNARNPPPQPEPVPEPEDPEPEDPEPEDPEEPDLPPDPNRVQIIAALFGAASYATSLDGAAPGGGAAVWVGQRGLRFGFSAALLASAELPLGPNADGVRGSVKLTRLPLALSASYLLEAGPFAIGPVLGLGIDLLRLRGSGVIDPQTELRANPGALLGVDTLCHFSPALLGVLRLSFSVFPRAYDLSVEPAGRLGTTPQLWLGAILGLGWQIQ
jgi:hypothetical protein